MDLWLAAINTVIYYYTSNRSCWPSGFDHHSIELFKTTQDSSCSENMWFLLYKPLLWKVYLLDFFFGILFSSVFEVWEELVESNLSLNSALRECSQRECSWMFDDSRSLSNAVALEVPVPEFREEDLNIHLRDKPGKQ